MQSAQEGTLRRLFDTASLARGRAYASAGAVVEHQYDPEDDVVTGEVQGTARHPYDVVVQLERSASGAVVDLDGDCTCPVGYNCKHVVALMVVSGAFGGTFNGRRKPVARRQPTLERSARPRSTVVRGTPRRVEARPAPTRPAVAWEKPLAELIRGLESRGPTAEPELALQFDLVPRRSPGHGQGATVGIRVQPVVRSSRGNWVRSGISWSQLEYRHLPSGAGCESRQVFLELLALHRLSAPTTRHRYYSYGSEPQVWLEDFTSRRLWDLLGQAEELSVQLVVARSPGVPVKLLREPAEVGADVQAAGRTACLFPYVEVEGSRVPTGSFLLIGDPPHGIAWWTADGADRRVGELGMAAFSHPLGKGLRGWVHSPPVEVPPREQTRFLREFYPRLARSMAVVSSDGSMALPELPRPVLVLHVRHDGQRSLLRWQRSVGDAGWREDLASTPEAEVAQDLGTPLAAAIEAARAHPALVEQTWRGERLVPALELSGMDAVHFVTELLPALAEVPDLLVEEVGSRPEYRQAVGAPVLSLRPAGSRVEGDWFDLMVEVTIDDEEVAFRALFVALAEGRSHLLLPSGTYFALDRPELAELAGLIAEARAMQDREVPASDRIRVSRFQAGLWEDLSRLGVDMTQAHEWEVAVRALATADHEDPAEPPEGLDATLRPYQQAGFTWLAFLYRHGLGGILADDMGLGKTLQALSLVCHARQRLSVENPFLVVAPTSVVENWAGEARRFTPELRVVTVGETEARRWVSLADLADKADVVVTSYTLFRLEYQEYERIGWAGLLLDEAQFVKNPRSIASQRARAFPAPFKLAITGTPIENNLKELWALLSITAPGLFPRLDRFVEHYAVPIERHGDDTRLARLRRRIRPLVIRRTKEQVEAELPAKQEQVLELELAPKHRRLYDAHLQRERQKVLGLLGDVDRHRIEILRSLTVLRQAALDVTLVDERRTGVPSTKLDALVEMLQEIVADGHRVLVFSQFTRFLSLAARRAAAAGIEHCYLDGRTRKRDKVIAAFRQGEAPVFFISLKAGGFGLNLTEADYCILLDPWWNPATETQAVDRAHRIGQTRKVMVYRLVSKDTIEEKVMALKARKAALVASIMDAGGFETAALSPADIRALLE